MDKDVLEQAKLLSKTIKFADISNIDGLDARIGWVNVYFHFMVGVNEGFIEFCPNNSPPLDDEWLAFLWIVRPDLTEQIKKWMTHSDFAAGMNQRR